MLGVVPLCSNASKGKPMRTCPRCHCAGVSDEQLFLFALTRLNSVSCIECDAIIGFDRRESLLGSFVASIFLELMIILVSLALFLIVNSVFFVFCVFITLAIIKALIDCKKPLVEVS